jgi:iron(III) transport system permease protein
VFAALPFGRLLIAALAPGGNFNPSASFAAATSRVALIAAWNTIETGSHRASARSCSARPLRLSLATTDIRGKRVLALIYVMSLLVAPQVAALAFKTLAGPASPLLNAIGLAPPPGTPNPLLGRFGVIFILALHHAPLVAITLATGLRAIPASLIEAAQLDGATPPVMLRKIILPLLRPHLIMAALLVFVAGVGNFGIPALLGLPANYITLPTLIYRQLTSFGPSGIADAAALSLSVAVIAGAGVLAITALGRRDAGREVEAADDAVLAARCVAPAGRSCTVGLYRFVLLLPFASLVASAWSRHRREADARHHEHRQVRGSLWRQDVTLRAFGNSFLFAGSAALILSFLRHRACLCAGAQDREVAPPRGGYHRDSPTRCRAWCWRSHASCCSCGRCR